MSFPDQKTYEKLYRRYFLGDRSKQMLELAGDITDQVFLDICCGNGRLTDEAMGRKTRKNIMIDSEAKMISNSLIINYTTQVLVMTVEEALEEMRKTNNMVDVAICQQGINYWLSEAKGWKLSLLMPPGGVFIFNTFNHKPSKVPKVREYTLMNPFELKESHYVEISWLVKNDWFDVYHMQICQGMKPHFTKFKWMSEGYIRRSLEKFFDVELIEDNKTSIYKCIRRPRQ